MTSSHRINAEVIADILLAPIHEVEEPPPAGSSSASNEGMRAGQPMKLCLVILMSHFLFGFDPLCLGFSLVRRSKQ
jgi:hypothetical protein